MARDRKRAKQRRDRRVREGARTASPGKQVRGDLPGSLDHASAEVDEFDAALVAGAQGVPVSEPEDAEAEADDALQEGAPPADGDRGDGAGGGAGGPGGEAHAAAAAPSGAPLRGGNRVIAFLRASWAELQRVQWPDRRGVTQATAVVLGFVAIAGLYLGAADFVAKEIVEFILG